MSIFFTADHHFGHANIIKYSNRPFRSVSSMDEAMLENWNSVVKPNDTVYHLGDLAFFNLNSSEGQSLLEHLNGIIYYIRGNHDKFSSKISRFIWIRDFAEIKVNDQKITLCHYAMRVWNCSHHGTWHLYGHSHGSLPDDPNSLSFDVGVDCWDFKPVSFEQVAERMKQKTFKPIDHHTGER